MALISLRCPNCSGDIELDGSREFGFCMYCGSKVMMTRDVNNISVEMSVKDQRASLKPLAAAFCRKGEYAKAQEITKRLIDANAADAEIWRIDGICRLMGKDIEGALASIEKASILSGSDSLEDAFDAVADECLASPVSSGDKKAWKTLILAYSRIGTPDSDRKALEHYWSYLSSIRSNRNDTGIKYVDSEAYCQDSSVIRGIKTAEIPPYAEFVPAYALYLCRSLTSVAIPPSVASIGDRAFMGCESLTSINLPPSVTSIGDSAFEGCHSLSSVTIPPSVTFIGYEAFSRCPDLKSVTVPSSVRFPRGCFGGGCKIIRENPPSGSACPPEERKGLGKLFRSRR